MNKTFLSVGVSKAIAAFLLMASAEASAEIITDINCSKVPVFSDGFYFVIQDLAIEKQATISFSQTFSSGTEENVATYRIVSLEVRNAMYTMSLSKIAESSVALEQIGELPDQVQVIQTTPKILTGPLEDRYYKYEILISAHGSEEKFESTYNVCQEFKIKFQDGELVNVTGQH